MDTPWTIVHGQKTRWTLRGQLSMDAGRWTQEIVHCPFKIKKIIPAYWAYLDTKILMRLTGLIK